MRIVGVVQARAGSNRLPAKVLLDLGGRTVLERCLARVEKIGGLSDVVVATTELPHDDPVALLAARLGFPVVRGSERDVLSRYALAASVSRADAVVRCTSDCPLLDPTVSTLVVDGFRLSQGTRVPLDYASNVMSRKLPRGLDTEIFTATALDIANRQARSPAEREHVTTHFYTHPDAFRCAEFLPSLDRPLSHLRWTLDTIDDYRFLCHLYTAFGDAAATVSFKDIVGLLDQRPELVAMNAHVKQHAV